MGQALQGKHEQPFNCLTCAIICDYGLVSSPHSLSTLLLFVDACSESGSEEQLRSYTKHNCEQKHHMITPGRGAALQE